MSESITVSLFLFLEKHPDLSYEWLEDAFGYSCENYDEDLCEMGGSESWNLVSLSKVFKPMSWSQHWVDQALVEARARHIEKCRRALLVLWNDYQPRKFKRKKPEDPVMIGPFVFEYDSEVL
jgi:hypothetical protein